MKIGKVAIRADAGGEFGLGHLSRSLAIAGELRESGLELLFLTRSNLAAQRAGSMSFEVEKCPADEGEGAFLRRAVIAHDLNLLVVDHKEIPSNDLKRSGVPIVLIDPVPEQLEAAKLAIYPVAHGGNEIAALMGDTPTCAIEFGAPYVIVRQAIREARQGSRQAADPPRLVVTTGGSDPAGVLLRVLPDLALIPADRCAIRILQGTAFAHADRLKSDLADFPRPVELLTDDGEFPLALATANLAVCAFGVTPYELAYLGVPAAVVSHSEENSASAARFCQHGSAVDLGPMLRLPAGVLARTVLRLLDDPDLLGRMREAGQALIDGQGAQRVASRICRELQGAGIAP